MKEGASKLARSAGASPAQVGPNKPPGGECCVRRRRRRREYCGSPERHEYELYLAVEDIDHTRTKTKSPQTNDICWQSLGCESPRR